MPERRTTVARELIGRFAGVASIAGEYKNRLRPAPDRWWKGLDKAAHETAAIIKPDFFIPLRSN